jgi:threonine aldolase
MVFASWPRRIHQKLHDAGAKYYIWNGSLDGDDPEEFIGARLVCDWSIGKPAIDQFLSHF